MFFSSAHQNTKGFNRLQIVDKTGVIVLDKKYANNSKKVKVNVSHLKSDIYSIGAIIIFSVCCIALASIKLGGTPSLKIFVFTCALTQKNIKVNTVVIRILG